MNLPLVGALCLSVVGWTFAVVYFRACQRALNGWERANETNQILLEELKGHKQLID